MHDPTSPRPAPANDLPRARRFPRPRFGLRALLAFVVAAAVLLGVWVAPYKRQERAIARLESLGATLLFDHHLAGDLGMFLGGRTLDDRLPGRPWLRLALGEHYATAVVDVHLTRRISPRAEDFTDADAASLRDLPTLERLTLQDTRLTDAGLMTLASLPALESLDAFGSRVTRDGVARFRAARPDVAVTAFPSP